MGVIKNDVGRPSNKTLMVRSILKFLGVVVIAGAIVWVSYNIKDNKETKTEVKENKKEEVVEKVSIEDAEELLDDTFGEWKYWVGVKGYNVFNDDLYKTTVALLNTKKLKSDELHNLLKNNYDIKIENENNGFKGEEYIILNGEKTYIKEGYSYDKVKKVYDKLYKKGNLLKDFSSPDYCKSYAYDEKTSTYYKILVNAGCGGADIILNGVYSTEQIGNKLYITIVNETPKYNTSDSKDYITLLNGEKVCVSDIYGTENAEQKIVETYKDNMHKYRLEFEKIEGNYKFVEAKDIN